jgi:hypothetical protein
VTGARAVGVADFFAALRVFGRESDGNARVGMESRGSVCFETAGGCRSAATVGVT